jgi:adenylosuccinate lyase
MRHNMESTRGVVFSQRVMLALVEKGLPREEAYRLVQRNAMRSWDEELDFRELLKSDPSMAPYLSIEELDQLFDYGYYLRYVEETFRRIGLESRAMSTAQGSDRGGSS